MVGMQLHKMIKFLNYRQLELHHECSTFTRLESNFFTNISWDAIGTELQCKKLQCKKNWSLNLTFFGLSHANLDQTPFSPKKLLFDPKYFFLNEAKNFSL